MSNFIAPIGECINKEARTIDFDEVREFGFMPVKGDQDYPLIIIVYKDDGISRVWEYETEDETLEALCLLKDRVEALPMPAPFYLQAMKE